MSAQVDGPEVVTRIVVDHNVRGLKEATGKITNSIDGVSQYGRNMFSNMFAAVGVTAAIAGATKIVGAIVGINSAAQDAQVGIAGMLAVQAGTPFTQQLETARGLIQQLRNDAAVGAGDLNDYTEAFQQFVTPVRGAGGSLQDVEKLVKLSIGAGAAMRGGTVGITMGKMDVLQALGGALTVKEAQILGPLMGAAGIAKLRTEDPHKRMLDIMKALEKMTPAVEAAGKTWSAQTATFRDRVSQLVQVATGPIFARWSEDLTRANDYLATHRDMLADIAKNWGERILKFYDQAIDKATTLAKLSFAGAAVGAVSKSGALGLVSKAAGAGPEGIVAAGVALAATALAGFSVASALENHPKLFSDLSTQWSALADQAERVAGAFQNWAPMFADGGIFDYLGRFILEIATLLGYVAAIDGAEWEGAIRLVGAIAAVASVQHHNHDDFQYMKDVRTAWNGALTPLPHTFDVGVRLPPSARQPQAGIDPITGLPLNDHSRDGQVKKDPPMNVKVEINIEHVPDPNRLALDLGSVLSNVANYRSKAASLRPQRMY